MLCCLFSLNALANTPNPLIKIIPQVYSSRVEVYATSDAPSCGKFVMQLELVESIKAFTGSPNYFSGQIEKSGFLGICSEMAYPALMIDLSALLQGVNYKWRVREYSVGSTTAGAWSATYGFGTPVTSTITTGTQSYGTVCAGSTIPVSFSVSRPLNPDNKFIVQLSNAVGSFTAPATIGTLDGTSSGTINAVIPVNVVAGTGYKVRVVSTSPVVVGAVNPYSFAINQKSANPTEATANPATICAGQSSTLTVHGVGGGTNELIKWYTNNSGSGDVVAVGQFPEVSPAVTTTYYVRYENGAPCNHSSAFVPVTVTVNTPPALNVSGSVAATTDAGECGAVVSAAFTATATGTTPVINYYIAAQEINATHVFTVGPTDVTVVATNSCGEDSKLITVSVSDDEAPAFTAATPALGEDIVRGTSDGCTYVAVETEFDAFPEDNCDVTSQAYTLSGDTEVAATEATTLAGVVFNKGTTTVTWTATDAADNSSSHSFTVTVSDDDVPTVLTKSISLSLDVEGKGSITPAMVNNGSTDNCGVITLSLLIGEQEVSQQNFTILDLGDKLVTLKVTDAGGNSAAATATVTVVDNIAPTITKLYSTKLKVSLDKEGKATLEPDKVATSYDVAGILTKTLSKSSFTITDIATTRKIQYKAVDTNKNEKEIDIDIEVVDEIPPTVVTRDITVYLDALGNVTVSPEAVDNGSSDAAGIKSFSLNPNSFTCANVGVVGGNAVVLTVTDNYDNSATGAAIITVVDNVKPVAAAKDVTIALDAAGSASISAADIDDSSSDACGIASMSVSLSTFNCDHVGPNMVTLTVTDVNGNYSEATATVTVENPIPVVDPASLVATIDPVQVNTGIAVSASYFDINAVSYRWNWIDGSGMYSGATGWTAVPTSGTTINSTLSFASPGLYTLTLEVKDICEEVGSNEFDQLIVIYDPAGGFVTGGGWVDSPTGAYSNDGTLTGKASFGFVSKYKKGATVPDGNTQFEFKSADLNFRSTSYEWLVVAGSKAKYKGEGMINGNSGYGFMLTATDGTLDLFRLKIWDMATDAVVYDNQMGADDDSYAGMALGGGSVVVHDGSKGGANKREVAVEELSTIEGFTAYPNPLSMEGLWLEFPTMEQQAEVKASIYDLSGRILAEKSFQIERAGSKILWKVDHDHWSNGMYLLLIQGERRMQKIKLLKQ
jgi:hypothetical protein